MEPRDDVLALISFDAASPALVEKLLDEGRLPALAQLRARGARLSLDTPATHLAAATYHTLWSGLEPGEHGLYYPFQWSAADQRAVAVHALQAPEAFWERLARSGRPALVVDPYEARRAVTGAGLYASGWQLRNRVALKRWSFPEDALRKAERRYGRGRGAEEVFGAPTPERLRRLARTLVDGPRRVADLVADALARERFDLVVASLSSVHLGGHQFWDPAAALGVPAERVGDEISGALRRIYEEADAATGRIVSSLPDGTSVIVFSATGMGQNTSRSDVLPGMIGAVLDGAEGEAGDQGQLWRLRARLPTGWRAGVADVLPDRVTLELTARLEFRGTDWSRTRAFAVPSDHHGLIRLNLRGRERQGIVGGTEVDELCAELAEGLATFCDQDGSPSVASVEPLPDAMRKGGRGEQLPDLVVRWGDRSSVSLERVVSPRFGTVRRAGAGSGRSGNHTGEGWALVVPGDARMVQLSRPARVVDLAATAVALAGVDPGDLAGVTLLEP